MAPSTDRESVRGDPVGQTFQPDIYPEVLSLLPEDRDVRILDAGAGEGYLCKVLSERGYRVEACDFLPENFLVDGVPFHRADLSDSIPLPDDSFDFVISIEVLEHLENHTQFIKELLRVTKPGGHLILTTPNVLSMTSRWNFFLYGFTDCAPYPLDPKKESYFLDHINPISLPEILFLVERFGGEMVDLTTNRRRRSSWLPMILLYPLLAISLRIKFLRSRHRGMHDVYRRNIKWVLHPASMLGRITIAVARKLP